jgi:Na+-driven multidrug efflux pump
MNLTEGSIGRSLVRFAIPAVSSMAAQNVGARKWDRVSAVARAGVLFSFAVTGSFVLIVELLGPWVLGAFLPADSEALAIAEHLNRVAAWSFIPLAISMVLFGVVRATGAVIPPLVILAIALLGVRFPLAALLLDRFQADAIWWSFPISGLVAVVLSGLYYKCGGWRSSRMTRTAPAP